MDRIAGFEDTYIFQFQPIVKVNQAGELEDVKAREVLLKVKETGRFPKAFFEEQLRSETSLHKLNTHYIEMIERYFQKEVVVPLHLNLDPKQVRMPVTWQDFAAVHQYAEQIILELTEGPIVDATKNVSFSEDLCTLLGNFQNVGFDIALDDVGTGENTFALAESLVHRLDYLKFTIIPFRNEIDQQCLNRILPWQQLAKKANLPLIIEAVETQAEAKFLAQAGLTLQQGFYWDELVDGIRHDKRK